MEVFVIKQLKKKTHTKKTRNFMNKLSSFVKNLIHDGKCIS